MGGRILTFGGFSYKWDEINGKSDEEYWKCTSCTASLKVNIEEDVGCIVIPHSSKCKYNREKEVKLEIKKGDMISTLLFGIICIIKPRLLMFLTYPHTHCCKVKLVH